MAFVTTRRSVVCAMAVSAGALATRPFGARAQTQGTGIAVYPVAVPGYL